MAPGTEGPPPSRCGFAYTPAVRWAPLFLLLTLAMASPSAVLAGTAVLYGDGHDAATAAAAAKAALGTGDFVVAGAIAERVGAGPLLGGGSMTVCDGEPAEPLARALVASRMSVDDMEYAAAEQSLRAARERLPCGAEEASRDDLYNLFFLGGIAAFNAGDAPAARAAFAEAATLDPARRWDDVFAPTAKPTFLEALQQVLERPRSRLAVDLVGVRVDGQPLAAGSTADLQAGGHLITIDGVAWWADVSGGAELRLQGAAALAEAVSAGDPAAVPWLTRLAADEGWTQIVVLTEHGARRFVGGSWTAERASGLAAPVAGPAAPKAGPAPMRIAGIGAAAGGAVLAGVGLGVNLQAYQEAGLASTGEATWSSTVAEPEYAPLLTRNRAGLGLAIGGGATAVAGVVVAILGGAADGKVMATVPWVTAGPDGVRPGIGGRF